MYILKEIKDPWVIECSAVAIDQSKFASSVALKAGYTFPRPLMGLRSLCFWHRLIKFMAKEFTFIFHPKDFSQDRKLFYLLSCTWVNSCKRIFLHMTLFFDPHTIGSPLVESEILPFTVWERDLMNFPITRELILHAINVACSCTWMPDVLKAPFALNLAYIFHVIQCSAPLLSLMGVHTFTLEEFGDNVSFIFPIPKVPVHPYLTTGHPLLFDGPSGTYLAVKQYAKIILLHPDFSRYLSVCITSALVNTLDLNFVLESLATGVLFHIQANPHLANSRPFLAYASLHALKDTELLEIYESLAND